MCYGRARTLDHLIGANPSKNYDTFLKLLQDAKENTYLCGELTLININIRRING